MKLMCLSLKKLAIKLFIKIFPILIDSVIIFKHFVKDCSSICLIIRNKLIGTCEGNFHSNKQTSSGKNIHRCLWNLDTVYPLDAGCKLNVHKTFRRRPGCLVNVLCTVTLRLMPKGHNFWFTNFNRKTPKKYSQWHPAIAMFGFKCRWYNIWLKI